MRILIYWQYIVLHIVSPDNPFTRFNLIMLAQNQIYIYFCNVNHILTTIQNKTASDGTKKIQ